MFILKFVWIVIAVKTASGKCGVNSVAKARVVGGQESNEHEFPWQAAIRWRIGISIGDHVCGGSLIHSKFVITAAHCFVHSTNPLYYNVTLGDHNVTFQSNKEQVISIKRITLHPDYDEFTYDSDVAIIELTTPAKLNNYVNVICLPAFNDFEVPGKLCHLSGWGNTNKTKDEGSKVLFEATIPIISSTVCNKKSSYDGKITFNMFCAGFQNGSIDACQGDSGGPLQCKSKKTSSLMLAGITSWGHGCGTEHKYGVYVRVRHYLEWINDILANKNVTTKIPPITNIPTPPIPVNTDAPTISPSIKIPPIPVNTDKPMISPSIKIPPIPVNTNKPAISPSIKIPPIPVNTNKPTISPSIKIPPIPVNTDKPTISPSIKIPSISVNTDKSTILPSTKISPIPVSTDKPTLKPTPKNTKKPVDRSDANANNYSTINIIFASFIFALYHFYY